MIPKQKDIPPHRHGIALYLDEETDEEVYLCPKCYKPVTKEEIETQ